MVTKAFWGRLAFDFGLIVGESISTFNPIGNDWEMFFNQIAAGLHPISDKANELPIHFHGKDFYISKQFYNLILSKNLIIDGVNGGLVVGPSHTDGGIQLLVKDYHGIRIAGEMEGREYLINPTSLTIFNQRIIEINNSIKPLKSDFPLPDYDISNKITKIIPRPNQIIEISHLGQSIVNKLATKQNLQELEDINKYQSIAQLNELLSIKSPKSISLKKWYQFWK